MVYVSVMLFLGHCKVEVCMRPGLVAQIISGFGLGSKDSNQTLYQAFVCKSFIAKKK
jgi:hypothetical protein